MMVRIAPTTLMTAKHSHQLKAHALVLISAGLLAATALSGCGFGKAAESTSLSGNGPALTGKTFGGPNPIIGATVALYTTGNSSGVSSGYGVAQSRQTTTTGTNGSFSFAGGYTCPAGQFAYIVSAGGNTGASSTASGAAASATWDGLTAITVTAGGSAYTVTPTVTITDPTGTGATATATLTTGAVSKITITNAGNNYTSPTVTITRGTGDTTGTGATATATAATGGAISSVILTSGGTGYDAATVTISPSDVNGSGATASAIVTNGSITKISLTSAGSGYDAVPTVTITNGSNGVSNPANNSAVLVAALGRCEDLYANTSGGAYTGQPIFISELSTIAAAYALGHFSTVTGTGSSTIVQIGSDAANNAAQIGGYSTGCVAGVGSCTTTAVAGLYHAFLNAAMLVNVFQNPITNNGANSTISGYSGAAPVVPQALINSIGNSLVACVNSAGGAVTSGVSDGSACGNIFKYTTLTTNIPAYTTATPTNTFTAMVNLAANPSFNGTSSTVTSFYNVASAFTSVYQPSLTAAPANDFTVAIYYPAGLGAVTGTQGIIAPTSGALDINDVFYVGNENSSSSPTIANLFAFSSNGALLAATPNGDLEIASGLSVDALGNGYFGNSNGSTTNVAATFKTNAGALTGYTDILATSGLTSSVNATAVDAANNVWALGAAISPATNTLYMSAAGGASFTGIAAPPTTAASPTFLGLAIDPDQNIWATGTATNGTLSVLPNSGSVAAPAYANPLLSYGTTTTPFVGIAFTGSPFTGYVAAYKTTAGITPFSPTLSGATITALNPGTIEASKLTGSLGLAADGAGTFWAADYNSSTLGQFFYNLTTPSSSVSYKIIPCISATAGATACTAAFASTGSVKPNFVNVDSAGSVWVGGQKSNIIQIIGTGAPAWPLLSLGKTTEP